MTALAPTFIILAMDMSNRVVISFTLVLFIVLVAVYSFWWRFSHFGGNPRFRGGFCHFGGSLIGSHREAIYVCKVADIFILTFGELFLEALDVHKTLLTERVRCVEYLR